MEQIRLNAKQIQNTLQYVDRTQSEDVKRCIFGELGCQCFQTSGVGSALEQFRGRPEAYLKHINDERAAPYWESLLPGGDGKTYILTGVVVDRCVCSLAGGKDAPLALCEYCCREFQEKLFGTLFDRPVEIEITSSYLRGGDRCSTVIRLI